MRKKYLLEEKEMSYNEILKRLKVETDIYEIDNLLCSIRRKKRRGDPSDFLFLLERNSSFIDYNIALTLKVFKHKATRSILIKLLEKDDDDTRESATDSLLQLYGVEVEKLLISRKDAVIQKVIEEWRTNK